MVSKNDLAELRKVARDRHIAATKKVSRLNRQQNLNISGTKLDPRRDLAALKRYNSTQLKSYIAKLDTFNSRETQYVGDSEGRPMNIDLWREYKGLETRYRNRVNREYKKVETTYLPSAYDKDGRLINKKATIGNRMKTVTPDKRSSRQAPINAVYDPPKRIPRGFRNERALKKMIDDMRKRVMTDFEAQQVEQGKQNFSKMSMVIKDKALDTLISKLTPQQFGVLWKYTTFATDSGLKYLEAQKLLQQGKESNEDNEAFQASLESAKGLALWASKLKL